MPVRITKRPVTVTAERYGNPTTGELEPGSVQRLARFVLNRDDEIPDGEILDVIRPGAAWEPDRQLEILDVLHGWVPFMPGDWLIRGVQSEVYPCADSVLQATYTIDSDA